MSAETLEIIVIGLIAVSIPFLYYWMRSLKFGSKERIDHSSGTALVDL